MGGNSPQSLVNATSLDIQAGELDVAILTGGESWRTFMRARKAGVTLDWPKAPEGDEPVMIGEELDDEPAGGDRARHLHAGAGVPDVRDGVAGRGRPDAPRSTRAISASCGPT